MAALLMLAAFAGLVVAGYAHWRLGQHIASPAAALATRAVLLAVGAGFGYVAAATYTAAGLPALPVFLAGVGAVHLPAAFILFLKRARGEGKS